MDRAACCVCFLSVWKSWSAWVDVVELDSLQARDAQRQHTVHCSGQAAPQHKEFCNCVAAAGRGLGWAGLAGPQQHNSTASCSCVETGEKSGSHTLPTLSYNSSIFQLFQSPTNTNQEE